LFAVALGISRRFEEQGIMTWASAVQSAVLLAVGAGAAALSFSAGRNEATPEVVLPKEPLREVVSRLDAIIELLRAPASEPSHPSRAIPETAAERTVDESATVTVLREILEQLSALRSSTSDTFSTPGGIDKNARQIIQTLDADKRDSRALLLRHFCWSPAQVYAVYGLPDMRAGGAGSSEWTYVLGDEQVALHFGFVDGRVDNVYATGTVR
jgi:hypothetical protein